MKSRRSLLARAFPQDFLVSLLLLAGMVSVPSLLLGQEHIDSEPAQEPLEIQHSDDEMCLAHGSKLNEGCPSCRHRLGGYLQEMSLGPLPKVLPNLAAMSLPQRETSWLNRPYNTGVFVGSLWGDQLIRGRVNQDNDFLGGYFLGRELDLHWGWETRLVLATLHLEDLQVPTTPRTSDVVFWDVNVHYYPWGNARWRPYYSLGLGIGSFQFQDDLGQPIQDMQMTMPWGFGMKYRCDDWAVVRLEILDNLAFGNGLTMHNISLAIGLEIRFGGRRPNYWPWNPSTLLIATP